MNLSAKKMVWKKFKAMFFPVVHLADSNSRRKEAISTQNQSNKAKKRKEIVVTKLKLSRPVFHGRPAS